MSPRSAFALALGLAAWPVGCHDGTPSEDPRPAAADATPADPPAPATAPDVDPRDQYALAQAIMHAKSVREDLEGTLARTRADWIGRRYRWEMAFLPALCPQAGHCVALPFDHHRNPDQRIRQGWLPRLSLDAEQREAMRTACSGRSRCVIDVSAALDQLELSTEQPTSMTLTGVEVHGVRDAGPDESWVLGPRRPASRTG
ncbi:MAG: hypothetical protein K0V04_34865 [Deltaproteobacteria bacterium]|nr:hypothetical protein [Deltaproteobacteria bacterium]